MSKPKQATTGDETQRRIRQWVRPEILDLTAYHVPDASGFVKLDAMENPYTWPEEVVEEWLSVLRDASLNRYPDPASRKLSARLHRLFEVPGDKGIMLGNGSDELIQLLTMAVTRPGRTVLAPDPAFSMYRMITIFSGMEFVTVPLREDFTLDREAMLEAMTRHDPAIVFIDYPNNPSGRLFDTRDLVAIIEAAPGIVVIDEAYHTFAQATFMPRLEAYEHLFVLRTLSKMGLAGLRLGILAGDSRWLEEVNKIRLPYNINILAQLSADFALSHQAMLDAQAAAIRRDRARLTESMAALPGITAYPSDANFILFRVLPGRAAEVFERIREEGVLIKNLHRDEGLLRDCLRVTVGTEEENRAFLEALQKALQDLGAGS